MPTAPQPILERLRSALASAPPVTRYVGERLLSNASARIIARVFGIFTPVGLAALAFLIAAAVLSVIARWQEMRAAVGVLLVVFLAASLWLIPRPSWAVEREVLDRRISVGDRALVHVRISNPSTRTVPSARMQMDVGPRTVSLFVPTLAPGETFEEGFTIPTRRRGVVVLGPILSTIGDPLGLMSSRKLWSGTQRIYVHPKTVRVSSLLTGFLRDVEGRVTQNLSSSDVSFHALRDYAPGDDRRSIHWRSTAHTGTLMVRQFEETRRASLLVVLSCASKDYAAEVDFETAVSAACSLALKGMSEDVGVAVLAGETFLPTSSPGRLLDAACEIDLHDSPACERLVAHGLSANPLTSVVVLLTGQTSSDDALAHARNIIAPSIACAALTCGARELSMRHVLHMPVFDLSMISQLPRALAVMDR